MGRWSWGVGVRAIGRRAEGGGRRAEGGGSLLSPHGRARLAGEGRGRAGGGGGLRRVAAGCACLRASSTAPALSGSLAGRGAAGEGGTEAIDRCSAEGVERSVSEVAEPEGPQLGGPPCCMVTHDHLLAASGSETPPPETPPPAMLLGVERLARGSAAASLGSAGFLGVVAADSGSSNSSSVAVS